MRHGNAIKFRTTTGYHCRNVLFKYYNNDVHVLYKTQEIMFSGSVSKDEGGKVARCLHSHVKWLYSAIKSVFCNVFITSICPFPLVGLRLA